MHKSRRQNAHGRAGNKSETSFGTKLVLYRCIWTYIGREVHGCMLFNSLFQKAYGKVYVLNQYLLCRTAVVFIAEFVYLFVADIVIKRHHPIYYAAGGDFYDAVCDRRDEFVVMRVE